MGRAKEQWIERSELGYIREDGAVCLSHILLGGETMMARTDDMPCVVCGAATTTRVERDDVWELALEEVATRYARAIEELPWDGEYVGRTVDTSDALYDSLAGQYDDDLMETISRDWDDDLWTPTYDPWGDAGFGWDGEAIDEEAWQRFSERVMHGTRYFALTPNKLIGDPAEAEPTFSRIRVADGFELSSIVEHCRAAGLIKLLKTETEFYRARTYYDDPPITASQLATPPAAKAGQGRMNAAGIPVFYGAMDDRTAATEVFDRAPFVSVGKFVSLAPIRVLDLGGVGTEESSEMAFLRRFVREITRAVRHDGREHVTYAPTQVFTEFLRWEADLDALIYPSSMTRKPNIAIFADHAACLPDREGGGQVLQFQGAVQYRYRHVELANISDI